MSVMVGLAEYFSKIPKEQRRRTIKFVTTAGHHAGSFGTLWMHDNRATFLAKTAVMINCEHVSPTQTYYFGPNLRKSDNIDARRWWVNGSSKLAATALGAWKLFGVTVYDTMDASASGDMGAIDRDVPTIQLIGIDPASGSALGNFRLTDGSELDPTRLGGGQALLTDQLADRLQAQTGDRLTVKLARPGTTSAPFDLRLVGIARRGPGAARARRRAAA